VALWPFVKPLATGVLGLVAAGFFPGVGRVLGLVGVLEAGLGRAWGLVGEEITFCDTTLG